jgi:S1-C subfamily serine protease
MTKQLLIAAALLFVCPESKANLPPMMGGLPSNHSDELAVTRVLKIHGMGVGPDGGDWFGTGFLVNTNKGIKILTNRHVCGKAAQLTAQLPYSAIARTVTIERISKDRSDLCLVSPDATLDTSAGGYDVASVVGPLPADVTIDGYPMGGGLTFDNSRIRAIVRLVDQDPQFNGIMSEDLESPIIPGSSGSPVLNSNNQLVGVVFGMDGRNPAHISGLGVPLAEVRRFLEIGNP